MSSNNFNKLFPPNFISARSAMEHFNALQSKIVNANKFPLYDIERLDQTNYQIRLALAGFTKDDISVVYEDYVLRVSGTKSVQSDREQSEYAYVLHKGISFGSFERSFVLDENYIIGGVTYVNGILTIDLQIIVPEKKRATKLDIK